MTNKASSNVLAVTIQLDGQSVSARHALGKPTISLYREGQAAERVRANTDRGQDILLKMITRFNKTGRGLKMPENMVLQHRTSTGNNIFRWSPMRRQMQRQDHVSGNTSFMRPTAKFTSTVARTFLNDLIRS